MTRFKEVAGGFKPSSPSCEGLVRFTPVQLLLEAGQEPSQWHLGLCALSWEKKALSWELACVLCGCWWQAPDAGEILARYQKARRSEL